MLVSEADLRAALRLSREAEIDVEPLGVREGSPERIAIREPGASVRVVVARSDPDPERAMNHLAVMEALSRAGFDRTPGLLAAVGGVAIEEWIDGAPALSLVPPPGSAEAAMEALAALHALPVREGLDWEKGPSEVLPNPDVPLFRLGFASPEREPARAPLLAAHEALRKSPFGFAHRGATAGNILLQPGRAWLTDFGRAGFGPQLFDVAAFLLTSGLDAPARAALAATYARSRGMGLDMAGLIDLAGLVWGLEELLGVPRRQVECFGDDGATEALRVAATRIERGIRVAAGRDEIAVALREALWPAYDARP